MAKSIAKMMQEAVGQSIVLSKESILRDLERMLEDFDYDLKNARSPKRKRQLEHAKEWYTSIHFHLSGGKTKKEVNNG